MYRDQHDEQNSEPVLRSERIVAQPRADLSPWDGNGWIGGQQALMVVDVDLHVFEAASGSYVNSFSSLEELLTEYIGPRIFWDRMNDLKLL